MADERKAKTLREIGAKGGKKTLERHGPEFFSKIGRRGGARVKELLDRAKAAEAAEQQAREMLDEIAEEAERDGEP